MPSVNIEKLLSPVDAAAPAGPNFYGKPTYGELDRMAQGRPEQQVGSSVIPAMPPDWEAVRKRSVELLEQTKDLRVAMYLVVALLQTEGLPGFRDGLRLLKGMLEQYWDTMHPQLDPEDGNDPVERMNILRVMAPGLGGSLSSVVKMVRATRLTASRQLGGFGLREIEAASNGSAKEGEAGGAEGRPDLALIEASAKDTEPAYLTAAAAAASEAASLVRQIEAVVDEKVGAGNGVDLKDLARALDATAGHLQKFLALKGLAAPPGPPPASGGGGIVTAGVPTDGQATTAVAHGGEIRSADDVRRLIDRMCEFYERTEPSSPVPIVLRRAQRLVGKNFWEILNDLSPSALDSVKTISGTEGPEAPS